MKITFIGTAGSTLSEHRSYPAILVNNDLLLDCGEGTTQKLLQLDKMHSIRTILFSHMHNDHVLGLFSLLWYYWIGNRKEDLEIFGPYGTKNVIKSILQLINTPNDMMKSFKIHYNELDERKRVKIIKDNYIITYRNAEHGIPSFSYRIESNNKSICYSGDTKHTISVVLLASNCDIFICETTMPDDLSDLAHKYFHCTPSDAAIMAKMAECKKLVLNHIPSHFINQIENFQKQAEQIFKKEVIIAKDLMVLEI